MPVTIAEVTLWIPGKQLRTPARLNETRVLPHHVPVKVNLDLGKGALGLRSGNRGFIEVSLHT